MDIFFLCVTWFGSILVLFPGALLIIALFWRVFSLADVCLILGGILGSSLITHLIKLVFSRPRPSVVQDMIVNMPKDFSFPSAHTAQATSLFVALALITTRYMPMKAGIAAWSLSGLIIFTVGYSRIYLKVHYVSDVIVGAVVGASWVYMLHWLIPLFITGGIDAK